MNDEPPVNQPGGARATGTPPGGLAAQRRRLVAKTAWVTALVTFVATQAAGWAFSRVADSLAIAATPVIHVESSGPIASPWHVTIPREPHEIEGSLVRSETITRWALNHGGGPSSRVKIELMIGGNRDYAVILDSIHATDVACRAAPAWTEIEATVGGEIPQRVVAIDLDSGNYQAMPQEDPSSGEPFRFPLQVSRTSLEFVTVHAESNESDCSFRLQINLRDSGKSLTYTVDDGGSPFRVVSPKSAIAHMEWRSAEGGFWTPSSARA